MDPADVASLKAPLAPDLWTATPVYWANDPFSPPEPPSPFVFSEIRGLKGDLLSIGQPGNHTYQDGGFLRLHVFVPFQTGSDDAYLHMKNLLALYRGLKLGNVQCMAATPPDQANGTDPAGNGNWFSLHASIDFYIIFNG